MLCGRGIKEVRYGSKKELQDTTADTLGGVLVLHNYLQSVYSQATCL